MEELLERRHLARAVADCRKAGDDARLPFVLTAAGQLERNSGNIDAALRCYEETAGLFHAGRQA